MLEIRFHGRGGQGTVLASISLAKAFFDFGYQVQTFPLFGVERRGAPVEAYLRIDKKEILIRSNVYEPDHLVVLDPKLLSSIDITKGLKQGANILINTSTIPENLDRYKGFHLHLIDAGRIALANGLGTKTRPIINTAMLGAFSRAMDMPDLSHIKKAITQEVPVKIEENIQAAVDAYDAVKQV